MGLNFKFFTVFSGAYRLDISFSDIGGAGTVKSESWSQFLLPTFSYEGWTRSSDAAKYVNYGNIETCWEHAMSFIIEASALPAGYDWKQNVKAQVCFDIDETIYTTTTTTSIPTTTTSTSTIPITSSPTVTTPTQVVTTTSSSGNQTKN